MDTANIQSILIVSDAITVRHAGENVAVLKRLRVDRGGTVTIEAMELRGAAGGAAGIEALLRLLAGLVYYGSHRVGEREAVDLSVRGANPTLVPGLTRKTIEDALTAAVTQTIVDHRGAIAGIDLARGLGIVTK